MVDYNNSWGGDRALSPEMTAWQAQKQALLAQRPALSPEMLAWRAQRPGPHNRGSSGMRDWRRARPAYTPSPEMQAWRDQFQAFRKTRPSGNNFMDDLMDDHRPPSPPPPTPRPQPPYPSFGWRGERDRTRNGGPTPRPPGAPPGRPDTSWAFRMPLDNSELLRQLSANVGREAMPGGRGGAVRVPSLPGYGQNADLPSPVNPSTYGQDGGEATFFTQAIGGGMTPLYAMQDSLGYSPSWNPLGNKPATPPASSRRRGSE